MQPDHRANLDVAALAVGKSLALAWAHFHLLRELKGVRVNCFENGEIVSNILSSA